MSRLAKYGHKITREGWIALPARYDDGGFTGANMERPALQHLLKAVETGEVDCVVVYKVDRLSRSLLDFTRILSLFEKSHVSFVAVTQQFNTSTSLGRLTLNRMVAWSARRGWMSAPGREPTLRPFNFDPAARHDPPTSSASGGTPTLVHRSNRPHDC